MRYSETSHGPEIQEQATETPGKLYFKNIILDLKICKRTFYDNRNTKHAPE